MRDGRTGVEIYIQPVVDFVALARAFRVRYLVLRVVLFDEILHDAARLEKTDSLAIREGVGKCRDPAIGVNGEEPGLFLGVFRDVNGVGFVRETIKLD